MPLKAAANDMPSSFPEPPHLRRRRLTHPNPIRPTAMIAKLLLKYVSPFLRSWKTTLGGVATIASGVAVLAGVGVSAADGELSTDQAVIGWGLVAAGIGQITGKDADKTGA